MKKKMINSKLGKILRRLAGEEAGQTLMEYVIIAVLIAAACTTAIIYFGRQNANQIAVAILAASGNAKGALDKQKQGQTDADANIKDAEGKVKQFSNP